MNGIRHYPDRKKLYICKSASMEEKISYVAWALEFHRVGARGLMPENWLAMTFRFDSMNIFGNVFADAQLLR